MKYEKYELWLEKKKRKQNPDYDDIDVWQEEYERKENNIYIWNTKKYEVSLEKKKENRIRIMMILMYDKKNISDFSYKQTFSILMH